MNGAAENDDIRCDFLQDLDQADHINLTDFESEFLESNLDRIWFSEKQRAVIDRMREKYESEL